jgi:hypothetical protein
LHRLLLLLLLLLLLCGRCLQLCIGRNPGPGQQITQFKMWGDIMHSLGHHRGVDVAKIGELGRAAAHVGLFHHNRFSALP